MPVLQDGPAGRRAVNAALLAEIISRAMPVWPTSNMSLRAPGKALQALLRLAGARGVIEGVLAAAGIPIQFITPASWKRGVGLTLASKDAARSEAIRRWPASAGLFARVKDDGRAEAAFIAVAGLNREAKAA